jgi:hypothetical protein
MFLCFVFQVMEKRKRDTAESPPAVIDLTKDVVEVELPPSKRSRSQVCEDDSVLFAVPEVYVVSKMTPETSNSSPQISSTSSSDTPVSPVSLDCVHCADEMCGGRFCGCVLDDGLEDILLNVVHSDCTAKGGCKKRCTGACFRFKCYQESARFLGHYKRTPLPKCVTSKISQLYGRTNIGYKQ